MKLLRAIVCRAFGHVFCVWTVEPQNGPIFFGGNKLVCSCRWHGKIAEFPST